MKIEEIEVFAHCHNLSGMMQYLQKISDENGGCTVWVRYNGVPYSNRMSMAAVLYRYKLDYYTDTRPKKTVLKVEKREIESRKRWNSKKEEVTSGLKKLTESYYKKEGEAYFKQNRSDNNEFSGFKATNQRWKVLAGDLLKEPYYTNEQILSCIGKWDAPLNFDDVDPKCQLVEDLLTMVKFADGGATAEELGEKAWEIGNCTFGAVILRNYCSALSKNCLPNGRTAVNEMMSKFNA